MANMVRVTLGNDKELDAGQQKIDNSISVVPASDLSIADDDENFIGRIVISGSGVFVNGPDVYHPAGFWLAPDPNSNQSYVCVHATSGSGFPLDANTKMVVSVKNLNKLDFYATGSAEICWMKI